METQSFEPRWQRRLALREEAQKPHVMLPQPEVDVVPEVRSDSIELVENDARYMRELGTAAALATKKRSKLEEEAKEKPDSGSTQSCSPRLSIYSENTLFNFPAPPSPPNASRKSRLGPRTSTIVLFEQQKHISTSTTNSSGLKKRTRPRRSSSADGALPQFPPESRQLVTHLEVEASDDSDSDSVYWKGVTPDRSQSLRSRRRNSMASKGTDYQSVRQSLCPTMNVSSPALARRLGVPLSSDVDIWM